MRERGESGNVGMTICIPWLGKRRKGQQYNTRNIHRGNNPQAKNRKKKKKKKKINIFIFIGKTPIGRGVK